MGQGTHALSPGVGSLVGGELSQSDDTRVLAPVVPLVETTYHCSATLITGL